MEQKLASIQTRNWGTIGGNLCHGDPSSDPAVTLIALKATLKMGNSDGERKMGVEDFFQDYFETALQKDELLLEIQVPVPPPRTATIFDKFVILQNDMAIVSVAASVKLGQDGVTCEDATIALGNVAPTPKRAIEAEKIIIGNQLSGSLLKQAGERAEVECEPISDIHASEEYRRHLVNVVTERVVRKAWEEAKKLVQ
jgi:carbon-monoxide dehydrogenase medium subunit